MGQALQGSLKCAFGSFIHGHSSLPGVKSSNFLSVDYEPDCPCPRSLGGNAVLHCHWKVCWVYTASYLPTAWCSEASTSLQRIFSGFWLFHLVGRAGFTWLRVCRVFACVFVCVRVGKVYGLLTVPFSYVQSDLFSAPSLTFGGSQGFQTLSFSRSESHFNYFLVPDHALHRARVQFLSSVKSITNHSSIFHIAKVGWHLNSVLTSFQHSDLWDLFMIFYFFTIIFLWGLDK